MCSSPSGFFWRSSGVLLAFDNAEERQKNPEEPRRTPEEHQKRNRRHVRSRSPLSPLPLRTVAQLADNETILVNDKNIVIRPVDVAAYNKTTGQTEDTFTLEGR